MGQHCRYQSEWMNYFYARNYSQNSRIWETRTLSACADSSSDTMKSCLFDTFLHFWALFSHLFAFLALFVTFLKLIVKTNHVSHIISHMSHVTFNLSLTQTATDLPLLIPPLSTVGLFQVQKSPT